MAKSTAKYIIEFMEEIKDRTPGTIGMASTLCSAHNWATSPSIPRTDKEHRVCRAFAKRIRKQLEPLEEFWFESNAGIYMVRSSREPFSNSQRYAMI